MTIHVGIHDSGTNIIYDNMNICITKSICIFMLLCMNVYARKYLAVILREVFP